MTGTVTITGTVSGYPIASGITTLSITTTGYVEGGGVSGGALVAYTIVNQGRINGSQDGVLLGDGGSVTNGSNADTTASIAGGSEGLKLVGLGTVVNFGTITSGANGFLNYAAVYVGDGGSVTNGSSADTHALIEGAYGVWTPSGFARVNNFGSIIATGYNRSPGVLLEAGGSVTNGTALDTAALISGQNGVYALNAIATVANFGTIVGAGAAGVYLGDGGIVTNGAATDRGALVEGYGVGVVVNGAAGAVTNFGVIRASQATGGDYGVNLSAGGSLTNGAVNDTTASIQGYGGVRLSGAGASANFGTIQGLGGSHRGYGAYVGAGASLTNGATNDTGAVIEGYVGAQIKGASTLTNFGTISGAGGDAIKLVSNTATLAVESGAVFVGAVLGDGGWLDLASGTGTLTGLFAGGDVTVSGSMAATTFHDFGGVKVGAGASFTVTGSPTVSAADWFQDYGAVSVAGTLTVAGALTVAGTLGGTGTLALIGGAAGLNAGTKLSIAAVTLSQSASQVSFTSTLAYAGKWTQSAGTMFVDSGVQAVFTGASDTFAGTLAGLGTVAFTAGGDTLAGTTLKVAHVSAAGATVTLSGAIANSSAVTVSGGKVVVAAAGASLTGTGTLVLGDSAANEIIGATAASKLTVGQAMGGAGKLGAGQMTLVIQATGAVEDIGTNALTIDTGANIIVNAGKILSAGAGGTTIDSALDNTGYLIAASSTLTVNGAVSGAGHGQVDAGTLKFTSTSTFNQNVTFEGTGGTLELAHGQTYSGVITGFSLTGATRLDLDDIAFISGTTKATYAGTTASGVLTVTNGTHTAHIHFTGNYTGSAWTVSTDGHGGTKIVDPTKRSPVAAPILPHPILPTHAFLQAMAGFGGGKGGAVASQTAAQGTAQNLLASPVA